jgi:molecular chaperone DnaJ
MNIEEAYKILGVASSATDDEIKKAYKKLAKTHHPDVDKTNPDKFKKINQAHDMIKDHRANPNKYNGSFRTSGNAYGSVSINDIFSGFSNHFRQSPKNRTPEHINTQVKISFKEAVMGCEKDISYTRNIKCAECKGEGVNYKSNGCDACDGFGKVIKESGNMRFVQSCNKCYGKNVEDNNCLLCDGSGIQTEDVRGSVAIQAGRHSGDVLRMQGRGNFIESNMFGEQYTDVFVQIIVEREVGLELINNDVVSSLSISLRDALSGCERTVKTIDGDRVITIEKMTHHKDEVRIANLGAKGTNGVQRVIINIEYPQAHLIDKMIELMKEQNGNNT